MTRTSKSSSDESSSNHGAPKFQGDSRVSSHRQQHEHAGEGAQVGPEPNTVRLLHTALLRWYEGARRDLPWRRTRDPYAIWLSEVMLQQTRVETVIPYFERFLARWPTVGALADAPIDDVLGAWSGLGYYRRARMLHAAAKAIQGQPRFPPDAATLAEVKGIGRYTAGAVASIAYGEAAPLVDGNVARVLARLFAIEEDVRAAKGIARLWALAEKLVHPEDPGGWNQALMELGATVCVPRQPRCLVCPVREACRARALGLENDLPRMKPKAKPQVQERWALVAKAKDGVSILFGQRRAEARFGGMWEPPSVDVFPDHASGGSGRKGARAKRESRESPETDHDAAARIAALAGVTIEKKSVARAGAVTHVLSHRRLEIVVLCARLRDAPVGPWTAMAPAATAADYVRFDVVSPAQLTGAGAADRGIATLTRKILAAARG
jgi:A/G-specific adenine glycosylase